MSAEGRCRACDGGGELIRGRVVIADSEFPICQACKGRGYINARAYVSGMVAALVGVSLT
jgi:DnaJ-class molecular chaperone